MKTKPFIAICLLVLGGLTVLRVNAGTGVEDTIRKAVGNVLPDVTVDSVTPTPIPGLFADDSGIAGQIPARTMSRAVI